MDNFAAFAVAVIAVLAAPGPTNTLLMSSGASSSLVRSLPLIPAETTAYALSISILVLAVGPVVASYPGLRSALHFACAMYLAWIAWSLWTFQPAGQIARRTIRFRDVFVTTMLNPKGLVFAFLIFPSGSSESKAMFLPHLALFAAVSVVIAFMWIALGAGLGFGASPRRIRNFQRFASALLLIFATLLLAEGFRRLA